MTFALTFLGITLSVIATFLVSRHYFHRSMERKLTPFIHLHSEVFEDIDPEVRNDIKIHYKDEEINDLTHYQVLIANTGDRAIRDFIKPLTVSFPKKVKILDVSILHKSPKELELKYKVETNENNIDHCKFKIPLLNKKDFFLVKFLLKGKVSPYDPEFRVTVDDIPPRISPEWLSFTATTDEKGKIEWGAVAVGIGILFGAVSFSYLAYQLWKLNPSLFPYPWSTFEFSMVNSFAVIFAALLILLLALLGLVLAAGIGFEEVISQGKHKFPLPKEKRRAGNFIVRMGEEIVGKIESSLEELKKKENNKV